MVQRLTWNDYLAGRHFFVFNVINLTLIILQGKAVKWHPSIFFVLWDFVVGIEYYKSFCREFSSNAQPFVYNIGLKFG